MRDVTEYLQEIVDNKENLASLPPGHYKIRETIEFGRKPADPRRDIFRQLELCLKTWRELEANRKTDETLEHYIEFLAKRVYFYTKIQKPELDWSES